MQLTKLLGLKKTQHEVVGLLRKNDDITGLRLLLTCYSDQRVMSHQEDVWGRLTQQEVYDCLPSGTLPQKRRTWVQMRVAIRQLSVELQQHLREVAATKENERRQKKRRGDVKYTAHQRAVRRLQREAKFGDNLVESDGSFRISASVGEYLALPSEEERHACVSAFIDATGNKALTRHVCVVCARELMRSEGECEPHCRCLGI